MRRLGGVEPGNEEPTRFVLAINLRTARFFGIEVQRNLLLQANELIE
jgi:hypothetical protein